MPNDPHHDDDERSNDSHDDGIARPRGARRAPQHDSSRRERQESRGGGGDGSHGGRGGPGGTEFLDLELSKVMLSEAGELAREVTRDLMREAIRVRVKERLGEHIESIAVLAADTFVDDVLANFEIERAIGERSKQRADLDDKLREIASKIRRPGG